MSSYDKSTDVSGQQLYNWDSYFISLGLLVDGYIDMAKGMVEHFIFEIKHYGKILNGSRSYVSFFSYYTDIAWLIAAPNFSTSVERSLHSLQIWPSKSTTN